MTGHQEWLEAPYTNASRQEAEYETWLDKHPELDPEEDHWETFEAEMAELYDEPDVEPFEEEDNT